MNDQIIVFVLNHVAELADLLEVIDAIKVAHGLEREQVASEQLKRRTERGGCS